jgi:hypothetical protein
MHRPLLIPAFVLLLASAPLLAQRGGGHASSGGHGGFASHGSFSGHSSGAGSFSGAHSSSAFSGRSFSGRSFSGQSFSGRSSARGSASRPSLSARGFNHSGGVRIRTYGLRNNCAGYVCRGGYPWGYGLFDPYWWWDSGSSNDQDQQDQIGLANEMNQQSLDEQGMREQGDQDVYARSAPPPPHEAERTEAAPATVLVFRDQRRLEVQNYAIVGQTLWNFAPQHTQKIPLSDLDLPATTKANDERGVDFRLPGAHEGQ